MRTGNSLGSNIRSALWRAKSGIVTVGLTYILAWGTGLAMVHAGNGFALARRDRIVSKAVASSPITRALDQGHPLAAAGLDFAGNSLAGVAGTFAGY